MSSAIDEMICPQCGNEHTYRELDCKTCEEYAQCKECGWSFSSREGEKKGYGAYAIEAKRGWGHNGTLGEGAKLIDFLKQIRSLGEDVDIDQCYVTRWSDRRKKVEKFTVADLIKLEKEGKI